MSGARKTLRVVIAGGGPAAVELLLALHDLAGESLDTLLVAPSREFVYQPLAVARPFGAEPPQRFGLAGIAADCGATLRVGTLVTVNARTRELLLRDGSRLEYDELIVATGATRRETLPGAIDFYDRRGQRSFRRLLDDLDEDRLRRLVFAVPSGPTWALPLYELALMTARRCQTHGPMDAEITLTTPEDAPLALFGPRASASVRTLLAETGVGVETRAEPLLAAAGTLELSGGRSIAADAVISLPRLEGPRLAGLPHDSAGFIPTTPDGTVEGVEHVYAAGDVTTFAVKQGGLATQQADAVAESIAASVGAIEKPRAFRPVLRGLLLTGGPPHYLRADLSDAGVETSRAEVEPLWWPPSKIGGRYLSGYVTRLSAAQSSFEDRISVEVDDLDQLLR
jgi:sulfide:quinone oxidoreductase